MAITAPAKTDGARATPEAKNRKSSPLELEVTDLEAEVAVRLRAVMAELRIEDNREMGDVCGVTAGVVNNWLHAYNLPRVPEMIRLCHRSGITLDWVYRGHIGAMDPKLGINLAKRLEHQKAPARP
jgi:hypothetical protein